jgi:hypothetical protein
LQRVVVVFFPAVSSPNNLKFAEDKILGHVPGKCKAAPTEETGTLPETVCPFCVCYISMDMYARKYKAEIVIGPDRRLAPLEWLDSFCMRNFTGSAEFDDTLPTGEGRIEAGLRIDPVRLSAAMSEWFTKRGKGNGQPVTVLLEAET